MQRIGVVGATGLMGHGIAKNIQKAGYELAYTVHRTEDRVQDLKEAGAIRAADHAELGRTCDAVVVCVTAASDVEAVVNGLLTDPKEGLIILDCSTSEPSTTLALAERAKAAGVELLDGPLTKGPAQAEDGTLNVILGGEGEPLERIRPVVEAFSGKIIETGPVGTAHTLKLVNNFTIQASCAALAEGFAVASNSGLNPKKLVEILSAGMYNSDLLQIMAATLDGDFDGMQFELDNARKDVRYYTRLAGEQNVPAIIGQSVHSTLGIASRLGYGGEYVPSVVKAQSQLNGVELD